MNIRVRKIRRIIIIDVLLLIAAISMFVFVKVQKRDVFTYKGAYKSLSLAGEWYKVDLDKVSVAKLTEDGKYTEEDISGEKIKSGVYEIGNYAIKIDDKIFKMNYVDEARALKKRINKDELSEYELRKYFYTIDDKGKKTYYFSDEIAAADQIEDNCSTNEYYQKFGLFDKDGFAIDANGVLLAYTGSAKKLTLPDRVTEIAENAMAADYERAENTEQIIIPGTVKKICSGAFSFTNVKKVIINSGVEAIETWAFGDSNIEEIHFPESVSNIQPGILDTEEGLDGIKIYCKQNSNVDTYFKTNPPMGDYEIIYE